METTTFVMCGGSQKRWNGPGYKHMTEIHGRPILWRTFDQVNGLVVVVASPGQFDAMVSGYDGPASFTLCDSSVTNWWAEGFLATRKMWTDRNVCLLGDVYFTHDGFRACQAGGLHVIGRAGPSPYTGAQWGETFALCWDAEHADAVIAAHEQAIKHAKGYPSGVGRDPLGCPLGTPWQSYRSLAGIPMEEHRAEGEIWVEINDWTDDVDDVRRAKMMQRRLESLNPEALPL